MRELRKETEILHHIMHVHLLLMHIRNERTPKGDGNTVSNPLQRIKLYEDKK